MFARRYFPPRYFPPRYWPRVGTGPPPGPAVPAYFVVVVRDDAGRIRSDWTTTIPGTASQDFSGVVAPYSSRVFSVVASAAALCAVWVVSDQPVTLLQNDDGTPDLTVSIGRRTPLWWFAGMGDNPITVDVSSITIVNAGPVSATVTGKFLSS